MQKLLQKYRVPGVHKEGLIIIMISAVITFICFYSSDFLGYISLTLTGFVTYFFRDPDRVVPQEENIIVSPADGIVQSISDSLPPEELGMEVEVMTRVSIFLNVFNVHVNRVPAAGTITAQHYVPGKFFNASLDKSSVYNERNLVRMSTSNGTDIAFSQIAGLIARRIVSDLEEGQEVKAGDRFGIIRFGSRTDVYIPRNTKVKVLEGQVMIGGETVIADLSS